MAPEKRVNFTLLQLPLMLLAYLLSYVVQHDIEQGGEITDINVKGSLLITVLLSFCMALLSYDDDIILFY